MNNIIDCRLDSTCKEIYTGIWQHDYGQILRITGVDLPKAVEVQFSLRDKGGDTLTRIGTTVDGVTEVKVPDSFLKNENCTQNYPIYAWIYVTDDTSGNTEYQIILHVKSRPKPEEPTEEPLPEPNIFHETVEAVNAAADRAETAEQNAKASATEAGKYATSASESAESVKKIKEDALAEVGKKQEEAIEAIQEQEENSVRKITARTDDGIQRIQNQTAGSKKELEQTITDASVANKKLDESIQDAGDAKTALDKSTELAGTVKTELDTSTQKAGEAKTALDGSTKTAGEMQETLSATVKQAGALDTSLTEEIETGTQLQKDLVASGEKAVQDIQAAGSEQLDKMQAVAEEFTADREQITKNKEDIGSLKEDLEEVKDKKITKFYASNQGETHLADSDNGKMQDMILYGRSEQKTTNGYQLIDPEQIPPSATINGVTYTNNRDGTVTINGTATANASFNVMTINLQPGTYYIRCNYLGDKGAIYCAVIFNGKWDTIITDRAFTIQEETTINIRIVVNKGNTASNKIVMPILSLGTKMHDYEPYTGGIPSPNPDYPQEIKSVVNPIVKLSNEDGTESQTVALPYTLNAIPVTSGGNVTIDGKQYIADYVDVERGKVVRLCKKEAVPNNCDWKLQIQSDGYKIGYSNSIFTDMETTRYNSIKRAISNLGDSSKTWSNNFCFGKSGVFWINPYTNNGELTVNDINNFLTEHPMEVTYPLKTPIEEELTTEQVQALKGLSTYYPVTNITVGSEQLYGYTAFNYPISMENGWKYVKQQLNDNRDYIYDMDLQSAEAYVNSEYAVALTELEVM